jgi:hypothetical protein
MKGTLNVKNSDKSSAKRRLLVAAAIVLPLVAVAVPAIASHSWGGYHWKRTTQEISPPIADIVNTTWDSYLNVAIADWNQSTVINSPKVAGSGKPRQCRATAGRINVCNASYGNNGWLGIASIWLSGGHISQGTVKMNDTYFNTAQYNTPSWRALVMCQEIGHTYGLDHQDENFATDNTNSCMDYTSLPGGNEHPDAHDYQQLLAIYNHLESPLNAMAAAASDEAGDAPAQWGRAVHFDRQGRPDTFERAEGPGRKVVTHVFWALGQGPRR